jgi:hypothetical protein
MSNVLGCDLGYIRPQNTGRSFGNKNACRWFEDEEQ